MRFALSRALQANLVPRRTAGHKSLAAAEPLICVPHCQLAIQPPTQSTCSSADAFASTRSSWLLQLLPRWQPAAPASTAMSGGTAGLNQCTSVSISSAWRDCEARKESVTSTALRQLPEGPLASLHRSMVHPRARLPQNSGAWPAAALPTSSAEEGRLRDELVDPRPTAGRTPAVGIVQLASICMAKQRPFWTLRPAPIISLEPRLRLFRDDHTCTAQQRRHYATPSGAWSKGYQAKRAARENTAPETDTGPKLRVNEQITAPFVRLVFAEGGHQVLSIEDALAAAVEARQDLVEVSPQANPPVCRLQDYNKAVYAAKLREKELKKKQVEQQRKQAAKDIRLSAYTAEADLKLKVKKALEFLQKGNRVRVMVAFPGRRGFEDAKRMLATLVDQIGDEAVLTERPQNDKVPKNFLVLNLAPAVETAAAKAPPSSPAQAHAGVQRAAAA